MILRLTAMLTAVVLGTAGFAGCTASPEPKAAAESQKPKGSHPSKPSAAPSRTPTPVATEVPPDANGCVDPAWIEMGPMTASLSRDLIDRGPRDLAAGKATVDASGTIVGYTVAPGDALYAIGKRFCIANPLSVSDLNHTRTIQPGEYLMLHPEAGIPWVPYSNPDDAPAGYPQIPYQKAVEAMSAAAAAGDIASMRRTFSTSLSGLFPNPADVALIQKELDAGDLHVLRQMFA